LPLNVTSVAVRSLSFRMPPPPSRPSLPVTRAWRSVRTAEFQMPPASVPAPEKPLRTVRPWIVTFPAVLKMSKTRSRRPASTIVDVAPAPVIVTGPVMSRSPVAAASSPAPATVSVNVPAGTVMVSAPESAFAALIASRSVQPPAVVAHTPSVPSAVVLTTNVAACTRAAPATHQPSATAAAIRPYGVIRAPAATRRLTTRGAPAEDRCKLRPSSLKKLPSHPPVPAWRIHRSIRLRPPPVRVKAGPSRRGFRPT
jgi:hypothetical protein